MRPATPYNRGNLIRNQGEGRTGIAPAGDVNNNGTTCVNLKEQKEYFSREKESTGEQKGLSLQRCKKILEQDGNKYTDEEVLKIRKLLYKLGNLEYQLFTELKSKQHDKRNPLRKSINGRTGSKRDKHPLPKGTDGAVLLPDGL